MVKCEVCGSEDIIKRLGVFVCKDCGTKYSVADMRNMHQSSKTKGLFKKHNQPETKTIAFLNKTNLPCALYVDNEKVSSFILPWTLFWISLDTGRSYDVEALRQGKEKTISCTVIPEEIESLILYKEEGFFMDKNVLKGSTKTGAELQGHINSRKRK